MRNEKNQRSRKLKTTGDVINALSRQPIPFPLTIGGRTFNLTIRTASEEAFAKYSELYLAGNREEAIKTLICDCFYDGIKKVWQKPSDIKVEGSALIRLKAAVFQHVLSIDISEFASKN